MKLLRLCVENFGKLENYRYSFEDGLNIVQEPNGFGKTTLAAFVKAMLYGLPKTGSRKTAENERRRYEPWQSGTYGGYLEFEFEGTAYRVTRHFGATAAKDSFSLLDLSSRKPSTRFSERLGEELFQLDAESFARSVFLSSPDHAVFATTSIRTKLSDLVDDTNDLNNYDTAMEALRKRATEYKAQRGTGGRINELAQQIEALEEQKYTAEGKKPQLRETEARIRLLEQAFEEKSGGVRRLREQIKAASTAAARRTRQKQLRELRQDVQKVELALRQLRERCPNGLPSQEEILEQRSNLSVMQQAQARLRELKLAEEDRALVAAEQACFPDCERAAQDVEACQAACSELEGVSARLHAQMLPEELRELEALSARFAGGAPDGETLLAMQAQAEELKKKELRAESLAPPEEERERLAALAAFFASGEPDDAEIERCEKQQQEIAALEAGKQALSLTPEEAERWRALAVTFASGVPSEQDIEDRQKAQKRITELSGVKSARTAIVQRDAESGAAKTGKAPVLCGLAGALLILAGIVCILARGAVPGTVILALGLAALIAAFWLHTRQMLRGQGAARVIMGSAITEAQEQELYDLQHEMKDFLLRFYDNAAQPEQQLAQLLLDRSRFLALREKKQRGEAALEEAEREIALRREANRSLFRRYYHDAAYWDGFTNDLMRKHSDYTNLAGRLRERELAARQLDREIAALRAQLRAQIQAYQPDASGEPYAELRRLTEQAAAYRQLQAKKAAMLQNGKALQARAAELEAQIHGLLSAYRADAPGSWAERLQALRKRLEAYQTALLRVRQYQRDRDDAAQKADGAEKLLRAFAARYQRRGPGWPEMIQAADDDARRQAELEHQLQIARDKLSAAQAESPELLRETAEDAAEPPDLDALQNAETRLQGELDALDAQLRALRQEHAALRRSVDALPACLDQLARLTAQKAEAQRAYALLGKTQEFLEQAKDSLSKSYVGTVESSFRKYADSLLEGQLEHAFVDRDLKLLIDEKGKAREAELFSTGTYECVMLCMRLALIDALFPKEKPFLILDDPFVNLDDRHTQRALELVKKIAATRQIVYLVCNSSRAF